MNKVLTNIIVSFALSMCGLWVNAMGQVKVDPNGVNVNTSGATVIFLTFGGLNNQVAAEATWCGELIPAAPAIGLKCNPATIFGSLPARFDLSTTSGTRGFTDIMSIPPSVARRAYQAAESGATSSFFYVRRFVSTVGGPDEFVRVTCRMSGSGGARTPFSLTDVELKFSVDKPVLFVKAGEAPPWIKAVISYNGTGRLKGRWEVVQPGDELPSARDLLTEASLPVEDRSQQRRYTQVSRFNVFLPPSGRYELDGPDPTLLPMTVRGQYLVLLRIEATDDKEGDSNLALAGAGVGVVHSGAVAGFPLPVLRYFVGNGPDNSSLGTLVLLQPDDKATFLPDQPVEFTWADITEGSFFRLEISDLQDQPILSAMFLPGTGHYRAPPWLKDKANNRVLHWRVVALDRNGQTIIESPWRNFRLT
jgi:hypothetical protein